MERKKAEKQEMGKKRKSRKGRKQMTRKKLAVIIICIVLAAGAGVTSVLVYMRGNKGQDTLKENQRYAYVYVSSIQGNEITYTELEESVITDYLEQRESETEEKKEEEEGEAQGGKPFDGAGNMEEEEGGAQGGKPSDRAGNMGHERTAGESGTEMPAEGGMPAGESGTEMPAEGGRSFDGAGRTNTEPVTALIPVGVTVHTDSDTVTTFQRLAAGDILKIKMETNEDGEEVMVEIWML